MAEYTTPTNLTFSHNLYRNKGIRFIPVPDNCENLNSADYSVTNNGCLKNVKATTTTETDTLTKVPGGGFGGNGVNYSAFTGKKATGVKTFKVPNYFTEKVSTSCKLYSNTKCVEANLGGSVEMSSADLINKITTTDSTMLLDSDGEVTEGMIITTGDGTDVVKYYRKDGNYSDTILPEGLKNDTISLVDNVVTIGNTRYSIDCSIKDNKNLECTINYGNGSPVTNTMNDIARIDITAPNNIGTWDAIEGHDLQDGMEKWKCTYTSIIPKESIDLKNFFSSEIQNNVYIKLLFDTLETATVSIKPSSTSITKYGCSYESCTNSDCAFYVGDETNHNKPIYTEISPSPITFTTSLNLSVKSNCKVLNNKHVISNYTVNSDGKTVTFNVGRAGGMTTAELGNVTVTRNQ